MHPEDRGHVSGLTQSTSGACVGKTFTKTAAPNTAVADRLDEQAEWLNARRGCQNVPTLLGRWHGGYTLEWLDEPKYLGPYFISDVLKALEGVWVMQPAVIGYDHIDHITYIERVGREGGAPDGLLNDIRTSSQTIKRTLNSLTHVNTHGDPTFSNLLYRREGLVPVLVDPLPATDAVPHLQAVDMACVLQSLLGWETLIRRDDGGRMQKWKELRPYLTQLEWDATCHFAAYKLMRALRYVDTTTREFVVSMAYTALALKGK